jgi:hypothetical protein
MPTPFTHLRVAQQLLADPQVPAHWRDGLRESVSAFFLGNIAADARVSSGLKRADTHFYAYDVPMIDHPWRVMLAQHPVMPCSAAHRAFLAGYVAHLSMDEVWTLDMMKPYFVEQTWGRDRKFRFFMLHILLIYLDERDLAALDRDAAADVLEQARPDDWLPFMPDADLCAWRDFIAEQLRGESQTLAVFGARINKTPAEFRAVLDAADVLERDLWTHVPLSVLAKMETQMYTHARAQMLMFLDEYGL